jgi:oligopeptide transport system ATP-binding protein
MSSPAVRAAPLLSVRRLKVHYAMRRSWPWSGGGLVRAIDDLHFNLNAGESLGIAGAAGAGKSTLLRTLAGLQKVTSGGAAYGDKDLARLSRGEWKAVRPDIQMVFQPPAAGFEKRSSIAESIEAALAALRPELSASERSARAAESMDRVGLERSPRDRRASEVDENACRRAAIARAIAIRPKILLADDPIPAGPDGVALADLLERITREDGVAMIVTSRDPARLRDVTQRMLVLHLGKVMEQGSSHEVVDTAHHPCTRALLQAGGTLAGEATSAAAATSGCVFRVTCPMADEMCAREVPHLRRVGPTGHAACHYVEGVRDAATGEFENPRAEARRLPAL